MDANDDIKHRDDSERGSNESVGSGSSFEELDMDQEEQEAGGEREEKVEAGVPEGEDGAREAVELVAEKKEPLEDGEDAEEIRGDAV